MPKPRNVERDRAIGARIGLTRVLAGMTRPQLGARIGITYETVGRYELGLIRVPASLLQDLGDALGCAPSSFLATDLKAIARAETIALPKVGSVARRHLDAALAVLQGAPARSRDAPFPAASPGGQPGSEAT